MFSFLYITIPPPRYIIPRLEHHALYAGPVVYGNRHKNYSPEGNGGSQIAIASPCIKMRKGDNTFPAGLQRLNDVRIGWRNHNHANNSHPK
ncbi:hypothetical protein [Sphaerisporangium dianthi]|uniref:Uncharacterized protein n=1 Tax=Sphaerisporangium dianthi TaxID=1436120 RepID=A0ABV9C8I9_9ACTN